MSACVLISGLLHKKPEAKVSKNGKPYVAATLKAREGDGQQFWRLMSFSETASAELLRLSEGDGVSVQGLLQAQIYQPDDGEPRLSLTVLVSAALAARPKPREKKPAPSARPAFKNNDRDTDHFGDEVPAW